MNTNPVLLLNVASTLFMTGVIWLVQVVHYPLMASTGRPGFAEYQQRNTRRTAWVVGPPMMIEGATAVALALRPAGIPPGQAWLGAILVLLLWFSTAVFQVPRHRRLGSGFDERAHRGLVTTNWIRTAAWSARSLLVLSWLS